jgi:uncharacterized membrane protein
VPTSRLEAFSDGVFAIAATLLVLEIPVPHVEGGGLADAILDQWPSYAAYVVSFAIIAIIWMNHHAVLGYVGRSDRALLLLNLNLLLWIALIAWPTSVLAEYMLAGGSDERAAALVYALTMTLMGVSFAAVWLYVTRHPRPGALAQLTPADLRSRRLRFVIGAPLYGLSVGLALVSAPACLAVNGLLAVYYAAPGAGALDLPTGDARD